MPRGKESTYSEEVAAKICEKIESGKSLREICRAEEMPDRTTVLRWLKAHPEFAEKYAAAHEPQAEAFADEILEVARNCKEETAHSSKVKISTLQWLASKRLPKKYGDKVQAEISGKDGGPVQAAITVTFVKSGENVSGNG